MSDATDPQARAGLERQLALLAPVEIQRRADELAAIAAPVDWRGPAADACRTREAELRVLIRIAADVAESTVHRLRLALAAAG